MTALPQTVPPGTILLDKYRVEHQLGLGGMGVVLAATHLQLQERVAIKLLLPSVRDNADVVRRFLREGQAAARLKGEHSARIIDVGSLSDGAPYLVMEYLDGLDLAALIAGRHHLGTSEAVDHILQACEGLAEAHAQGLIHRDVKPANFFLTRRPDGSPLLKILDFGISKSAVTVEPALTQAQTTMGTPSYMSPEQMRSARDVDARADIWGLGATLYECLSGRTPFVAESFSALCFKVATEAPDRLPTPVPPGIASVVYRCLEKDPALRFATVAELALHLAPFATNATAAAVTVERTQRLCNGLRPSVTPQPAPAHGAPTTIGNSAGQLAQISRSSHWRGFVLGTGAAMLCAVVGILSIPRVDQAPEASADPTSLPFVAVAAETISQRIVVVAAIERPPAADLVMDAPTPREMVRTRPMAPKPSPKPQVLAPPVLPGASVPVLERRHVTHKPEVKQP
jgi:serine/threonine-protein kinase